MTFFLTATHYMAMNQRIGNELAAVYGLFDSEGRCIYVGCTRNPHLRLQQHPRDLRELPGKRILDMVPVNARFTAERQWISFYDSIGEASRNKVHTIRWKNQKKEKNAMSQKSTACDTGCIQ